MKQLSGLALLLASSACASSVLPPQIPQYDRDGKEIIFISDPHNRHETKDHGAIATYVNNQPRVFYNPAWFASIPEEVQMFFFQHEVAHFRLRHLDIWHATISEKKILKLEMQADCHSLMYLHNKLLYTPSQFAVIFDQAFLYLEEERAENLVFCLTKK